MRILTRESGASRWVALDSATPAHEAELQDLLAASPSLIPLSDIEESAAPLCAAVKEMGLPGSGMTDIVAFNPDGEIAIVECKLAANQEAKRKVIGQILEYGAYLWQMSYEELNERVRRQSGQDLVDLVQQGAGEPLADEDFSTAVSERLSEGRFHLIVAVDGINDELARIIRFVNEGGETKFSLQALEMRLYRSEQTEVLVPHLFGVPEQKPVVASGRHQWTRQEFLQVAADKLTEPESAVVRELLEWGEALQKEQRSEIRWGTGAVSGSFTFWLRLRDTRLSIFSVSTNGGGSLHLGMLMEADEDALQAFLRDVEDIGGFGDLGESFGRWPSFALADVFAGKPQALQAFKKAITDFGARIESGGTARPEP